MTFVTNVSADELFDYSEGFTLCETNALIAFRLAGIFILIAQILVPLVLVVVSAIDLIKVVISAEDKDFKASIANFVKKLIAAFIIFFIPVIVEVVLGFINHSVDDSKYVKCQECLLSPTGDSCTDNIDNLESNEN